MRRLATIVVFALVWVSISAVAVAAEIDLEPGATFDDGICWEADGTEGISTFDGQCLTPADYDAIYNVEVLAATPSIQDPDVSIAELYGMDVNDSTPASDKPIGEGLVESGTEQTFKEKVAVAHASHLPIAE